MPPTCYRCVAAERGRRRGRSKWWREKKTMTRPTGSLSASLPVARLQLKKKQKWKSSHSQISNTNCIKIKSLIVFKIRRDNWITTQNLKCDDVHTCVQPNQSGSRLRTVCPLVPCPSRTVLYCTSMQGAVRDRSISRDTGTCTNDVLSD